MNISTTDLEKKTFHNLNVSATDLEKTFHTLNICAADLEKTVYALNCDPSSHRTVLRPCLSKKNSKPVFRRFTLILENREKRKKEKTVRSCVPWLFDVFLGVGTRTAVCRLYWTASVILCFTSVFLNVVFVLSFWLIHKSVSCVIESRLFSSPKPRKYFLFFSSVRCGRPKNVAGT